jgi:hypothetical protein
MGVAAICDNAHDIYLVSRKFMKVLLWYQRLVNRGIILPIFDISKTQENPQSE